MILLKLFLSLTTWAYIPPAKMILLRLAENNGSGTYQIEQELQFMTGSEPITIHETWISEGDKGLRLIATGQNELKDKFKFQALYVGGQKWTINKNQKENIKIPIEMTERPFHQRSVESISQWLISLDILPAHFLQQKAYTKEIVKDPSKDPAKDKENFNYPPENYLRLGRTAGVVAYTLGAAPNEASKNSSGLWVEQDQFQIRKIRWSSQSELTVEEVGNYSRGLSFPKTRLLRWGNQSVQMRTISVTGKSTYSQAMQPSNLEANRFEGLDGLSQKDLLIEFYQRFR